MASAKIRQSKALWQDRASSIFVMHSLVRDLGLHLGICWPNRMYLILGLSQFPLQQLTILKALAWPHALTCWKKSSILKTTTQNIQNQTKLDWLVTMIWCTTSTMILVVDFQHCIFGKTATNLSAAKEFYDGYNSGFALKWMWTSQFKIAK